MHAMIAAIENWITGTLGTHLGVFLCSMIPIIELRGAIPLGAALGLPWWQNYLFAVLGNMIPVPFILLFIRKLIAWMQKSRVKLFRRFADWLVAKAEKNRERIAKYSFFGVCLFVAIPLPVTGAWTGSLVAATIRMNFFKALLSCLLGVMIAGVIMTLGSYGVVAAFSFFA
ncbi:MAG: small multidrug export protein [Ruminococcaceae bacterium]|nr:small multidrug export protein [Oscillospiraceae bacterium]